MVEGYLNSDNLNFIMVVYYIHGIVETIKRKEVVILAEKIKNIDIVEQHNQDMLLYSIYVARKRVIPDYRDGLKTVHRRILYDMFHDLHAAPPHGTVKTSRVTGDVIGRYHPHGDTAVADAMKPMTNSFECKEPYLDGRGGWGDPLGNPMSHPRYTETRLSQYSMDCLIGELKETPNAVDWENNYSDTMLEPIYLPAAVPNLLINGAYGIASGLSVDIPRHNLVEVIDTTIALMHNPKAKVKLAPDNCMETEILCDTGFENICKTGRGKYKVRALIECTEYQGKSKHNVGKPALKITSVPDLVFFNRVKQDIEKLITSKKLPQVTDIINESQGESWDYKMCVWIILKKGADPNYVRSLLYSATKLENGRGVNFEVLRNDKPELVSYKEYLLDFINFRRMTKFRMYCNRLKVEKTKFHKMELYIKALESGEIDNIYKMVRSFKGTDDPTYIEYLIKKLKVTDVQAKFLLDIDFRKVSKGYLAKYKQLRDEAQKAANHYFKMMSDEKLIDKEIIDEMLAVKAKYGKPRMSKIITKEEASAVPAGTFKVVITSGNRIRKMEPEAQITGLSGETPRCIVTADNRDNILIFGALGKVFKVPVSVIPFDFIDIRYIIKNLTSDSSTIIMESALKKFAEHKHNFIYTLSRNGYIKRMDCEDFLNIPLSGIIYSKLDDGDIIVDIVFMPDKLDLMVFSRNKALRMSGKEAPYLRRTTKGNFSMNTQYPMNGIACIFPGATSLVVTTKAGYVNRIHIAAIKQMKRMLAGVSVIKLGKTDDVYKMFVCHDNDVVNLYHNGTKTSILVKDIEHGSSISKGKKLVSVVDHADITKA